MQVSPHIFPANRCPYICLHCTQFLKQILLQTNIYQRNCSAQNPPQETYADFHGYRGKVVIKPGAMSSSVCSEKAIPCGLDPDAPIFTPPSKRSSKSSTSSPSGSPRNSKEPQCSRYSRRSVRQLSVPASPRPILGTKAPFPRPILGRKENGWRDEADEFIGREFRNLNRTFPRMRASDEGCSQRREEHASFA